MFFMRENALKETRRRFTFRNRLPIADSRCPEDRGRCWPWVTWKSLLQEEALEVGLETSDLKTQSSEGLGGRNGQGGL